MRLEKTVYPLEYCVYLAPNLSSLTFAGTVNVKCHTTSPRSEITLNCADLLLSTCSINGVPCEYTLEPDLERLVITAQKELTGNFLIEIAFTGIHNDRMHGFYASTYEYTTKDTRNVSTRVMVSTQCQATHCRRVFPCFDEPAFKAVFNVRVKTPNGYTALSNMHTTSEPNLNEDSNDSHLVEFAPTPLMSTYLFAVVVAELGYIEKQSASGTLCRVYTPPGLQDQGWFSMTVCIWALDFFSEHFGPFPLTKLDMVSIPDFTGYAMENWGLMLFKPLILLCDSSTSPTAKRELAGVVSHEVAHQWFGNLVTLEWWNATWLNEGFATYAGWLAVDVLFPSWDIWTFYIIDDLANALQLDALETSHAVDTKVANTSWQINAVFDAISYSKGAALIVMLSEHLGISTFMHGVRAYIQANQYANCTSHELFQCLARESGVDVVKMMDRWTTVKGFPLITVHDESYDSNTKEMHLIVSQEPFYAGGCRGDTDADQQPWAIPIQIGLGNGRRHACFFSTARSTLTFPLESCDAFYKLNDLKTGMYRTLDTRGHTRSLGECISKQNMPCADRIGVLSDVFALCKGGYLPTTDFLDLALCFSRETDHLVLHVLSGLFEELHHVFGIDEMYHLIQHVFVSRLEMTHQNELAAHLTESLVKGALARSGHQQTIKALCTMFDDYIVKNEQIPAHLREIVYKYGMKHCQNEHRNFDFMMARFNASQNPDERMAAAACLGCVNNSAIKAQVLAEIMDATRFKRNEINVVLEGFAPDLILWDWMVANWTDLYTLKDSGGLLAHVFTTCTGIYTDEFLQTVHEWEREHKSIETIQHKVDIVLEMLEIGNKWRRRDSAAISKWLADWSESLDVRRV